MTPHFDDDYKAVVINFDGVWKICGYTTWAMDDFDILNSINRNGVNATEISPDIYCQYATINGVKHQVRYYNMGELLQSPVGFMPSPIEDLPYLMP